MQLKLLEKLKTYRENVDDVYTPESYSEFIQIQKLPHFYNNAVHFLEPKHLQSEYIPHEYDEHLYLKINLVEQQ